MGGGNEEEGEDEWCLRGETMRGQSQVEKVRDLSQVERAEQEV